MAKELRLDHVSVVVDDLAAAIAFFTALGMTVEGEAPIEGPWVDRINGIEGVQVDIVMMRTPDGHGRLELTKFRNPKLVEIEPAIAPPNALGLRSVMFAVDSVDDTVARLRANGAELVGEVAQYEDKYRLCYMRGPAGIIVSLAEELAPDARLRSPASTILASARRAPDSARPARALRPARSRRIRSRARRCSRRDSARRPPPARRRTRSPRNHQLRPLSAATSVPSRRTSPAPWPSSSTSSGPPS